MRWPLERAKKLIRPNKRKYSKNKDNETERKNKGKSQSEQEEEGKNKIIEERFQCEQLNFSFWEARASEAKGLFPFWEHILK